MRTLTVLTTATPRPDLHKEGYFPILEFLSKHFQLKLYIHLDNILGEEAWNESLSEFEKLPYEKTLIEKHEDCSFRTASKETYLFCKPQDGDELFLWLEDDWLLTDDEQKRQTLLEEVDTFSLDFISTTLYNYPCGNPTFFKRKFFEEMKAHYAGQSNPFDGEIAMWECCEKIYGEAKPRSRTKFLPDIFFDLGRDWRSERSIDKVNKRGVETKGTWVFKK